MTPEQTKTPRFGPSGHGYSIVAKHDAAGPERFVVHRPDGSALAGVYESRESAELAADGDYCSRLMAGAKPTHDNEFKLTLVERTLESVLVEARSAG